MPRVSRSEPQLPAYLRSAPSEDGAFSRFTSAIGSIVGHVFLAAIIGILAIACLFVVGGLAFYLVADVLVPVLPGLGQTVEQAVRLLPAFGTAAWQEVAASAAIGLGIGIVVGLLRYQIRVRSRRVEEIVTAVSSPSVLSAVRVGASCAAIYAVAGCASGAILSWLGLPLPAIISGNLEALTSVPTPAVAWLTGAGLLGSGAGSGGPETIVPLSIVLLVFVLLAIVAGAICLLGLALVARAMASGAVGSVAQAFGIALTVAITELWRRYIYLRPRPRPAPDPITLLRAIDQFSRTHPFVKDPPEARRQIGEYVRWLAEGQGTVSLEEAAAGVFDYNDWIKAQGGERPRDVLHFGTYLSDEIADRAVPVPQSATDDAAWMREISDSLFHKGWFSRTLATGAVAGALTGVLEALIAGIAIYASG